MQRRNVLTYFILESYKYKKEPDGIATTGSQGDICFSD